MEIGHFMEKMFEGKYFLILGKINLSPHLNTQ